jgi:hypothetical protein
MEFPSSGAKITPINSESNNGRAPESDVPPQNRPTATAGKRSQIGPLIYDAYARLVINPDKLSQFHVLQ